MFRLGNFLSSFSIGLSQSIYGSDIEISPHSHLNSATQHNVSNLFRNISKFDIVHFRYNAILGARVLSKRTVRSYRRIAQLAQLGKELSKERK